MTIEVPRPVLKGAKALVVGGEGDVHPAFLLGADWEGKRVRYMKRDR